jgi:alkaline phosphatase D
VGSQVLNPVSPYDKWSDFPAEYQEMLDFIKDNNIEGVIFLTGDRHHSEIIRINRPGTYPLYDVTVSPLTSGTHAWSGAEINNPYRVLGIAEKQNYARFNISGTINDRKLKVEFLGIKGEKLGEWSIHEKELKSTSQTIKHD